MEFAEQKNFALICATCAQNASSASNLLQSLFGEAEEEEGEEEQQQLLAVVMSDFPLIFDKRDQSYFRRCLDWLTHVSKLNCEGPITFYRMYSMHYHSLTLSFDH